MDSPTMYINSATRQRTNDVAEAINWWDGGDAVFSISGNRLIDWTTDCTLFV